ncbi:MAG: hypothetical protein ACRYGL_11470 [Janthinobacterium lividum]
MAAASTDSSGATVVSVAGFRRRPVPADDSRSCSAAARRVAAFGERRIFTAASLRVAAGLLAVVLAAGAVLRAVGVSARGVRVVRLAVAVFAADARGVALRAVRDVLVFAAGLRVVGDAARFGVRAVAALVVRDDVAAGFAVRVGVLRAVVVALARVVPVRAAAVRVVVLRVEAARAVVGRLVLRVAAVRLAGAAAFARVVFFGAALVAAALVRGAAVRVVLARVVDAFVVRGAFAAATALGFGPGFFVAVVRAAGLATARVVRAVVPRALLPAVRRPPARIAMARVRRPPVVSSLLMLGIPCSIEKWK